MYISLNKNFVKNSTKLLIILNVHGCYRRSRSALTLFPAQTDARQISFAVIGKIHFHPLQRN
jgi:hypothetical protein